MVKVNIQRIYQKVVLTRSDFLKETGIYEMDLSHKILIDKG
ncbi:histidine phosphatase family protein [Bacillus cereus]|nr:histidine phosphatase family protein [Bacillus cereus]